ncbi:MAG TPA: DUF63 family protein [Methanocorpusculum sp.]|nr:DUF63 family protein [Methanocorpusculum sp.]
MPTFDDIYQWFVDLESSNYTIIQTILYAILVLAGLYILYRWVEHQKLPIDTAFVLSSILYVIWGGLLHVVYDVEYVKPEHGSLIRVLLTTPQVYIIVMIVGLLVLFISFKLQQKRVILTYIKPFTIFGVVACIITIAYLAFFGFIRTRVDIRVIIAVLAMAMAAIVTFWALMRFVFRWKAVSRPLYICLMASHFIDAAATSYSIELHPKHYIEQHVLGRALIDLTGTAFIMFALKAVILILAIWMLERLRSDEKLTIIWYLVIFVMMIVGLGPGIRDLMRAVLWI